MTAGDDTDTDAPPPAPPRRKLALTLMFVGVGLAAAAVASPLWVGLMLGTVMAFSAQPLFRWLVARRIGRRTAAAFTTFAGGLALLLLATLAVYVVVDELVEMAQTAQADLRGASTQWPPEMLDEIAQRLGLDQAAASSRAQELLAGATSRIAEAAGDVLRGITDAILSSVVALWTMYSVLVNWPRLAARLERVLPFEPRHTRALILEFRDIGRSAPRNGACSPRCQRSGPSELALGLRLRHDMQGGLRPAAIASTWLRVPSCFRG